MTIKTNVYLTEEETKTINDMMHIANNLTDYETTRAIGETICEQIYDLKSLIKEAEYEYSAYAEGYNDGYAAAKAEGNPIRPNY